MPWPTVIGLCLSTFGGALAAISLAAPGQQLAMSIIGASLALIGFSLGVIGYFSTRR
jgi:hypothetical protein